MIKFELTLFESDENPDYPSDISGLQMGMIFDEDLDTKWERAMGKLGISPHMLSDDAGHA